MKYALFLDDERHPKTKREFVIVRSVEEAILVVEKFGLPEYVSFDHDLGAGPDGYDFAKYLVEQDMNETFCFSESFSFNVHSANNIGANNIQRYMDSYLAFKKQQ